MARSIAIVVCSRARDQLWQSLIVTSLTQRGLIPYILRYGVADELALILPGGRKRLFDQFRQSFGEIIAAAGVSRPSVLCLGVGNWLMTELMKRDTTIHLDKIMLIDSQEASADFWTGLVNERRILALRHESTDPRDLATVRSSENWTAAAQSSESGFDAVDAQCARWSGFLAEPLISPEDQHQLDEVLTEVQAMLCREWGLPSEALRLSVYLHDKDRHLLMGSELRANGQNSSSSPIRLPVEAIDGPAVAFRQNRSVIKQPAESLGHELSMQVLSGAAPLRAPQDGELLGSLAVESCQPEFNLRDAALLRASLMAAAARISDNLVGRSSGY